MNQTAAPPTQDPSTRDLQLDLQATLEERLPHALDLLRRMVEINSYTAHRDGVEALGDFTAELFEEFGFSAERVETGIPYYGRHLVLTREASREPADDPAPTIAMVSHLDTVFPAEEERNNDFHWREDGDRIYGPGTVDIKGGTMVIWMIFDALRRHAPETFEATRWVVLLDSAEERGCEDFEKVCTDRLDPATTRACLVFEGGIVDGERAPIVVARKGISTFRVEVEGRAAHAGSGHAHGASAIAQLAEVVQRIESWTDYDRHLTFNVGICGGGNTTNRVPHHAFCEIDMRAFTTDAYDDGVAKMLSLRELSTVRSPVDGHACEIAVDIGIQRGPWARNQASDDLLDVYRRAGERIGLKVETEERGGLSDGNLLWHSYPTLDGLGPSGANAHCSEHSEDGSKEQEYATRSSFVPKALLNCLALLELLS